MKKFNLESLKIDVKIIPADKKKMLIKEFVAALIMIAVDWISKLTIFSFLERRPGNELTVIENFFYLSSATNDGVAFGMFPGFSRVFGVFSIVISAAVVYYLIKNFNDSKYMRAGLLMIFAGGFANGVERLIFGYVRDFLYFTFYTNFNIADSLVVVGAGLLIVYLIFFSSKDLKEKERLQAEKEEKEKAEKAIKENAEKVENDAESGM
jgi:signal peptidase II